MNVKSSNRVENIVANGDIAHYEQFLLLPQRFQKSSAEEASESIILWERVENLCRATTFKPFHEKTNPVRHSLSPVDLMFQESL